MVVQTLLELLEALFEVVKGMGVLVGCCIGLALICLGFYCPVSWGLSIHRAGRKTKSVWKLFLGIIVLMLPFAASALWFLHVYGWRDLWMAYAMLYCFGMVFICVHAGQVWSDAKKFHSWPVMIIGGIEFVSPFALLFGIHFNPLWAVGLMLALPCGLLAHKRLLSNRAAVYDGETDQPSHA